MICEITDIKGQKHFLDFNNLQSTFINVDCMEALRKMPDNCIDLCICDPPYGTGIDEESENKELGTHFHGRGRSKKYQEVYAGDAETPKNLGGGGTDSAAGSTGTRRTHFTFGYRKNDKNYEQKRKQAEELRKKS